MNQFRRVRSVGCYELITVTGGIHRVACRAGEGGAFLLYLGTSRLCPWGRFLLGVRRFVPIFVASGAAEIVSRSLMILIAPFVDYGYC